MFAAYKTIYYCNIYHLNTSEQIFFQKTNITREILLLSNSEKQSNAPEYQMVFQQLLICVYSICYMQP